MNVSKEFIVTRNRIIRGLKENSWKTIDDVTSEIIALRRKAEELKSIADSYVTRAYVKKEPKFNPDWHKHFVFDGDWKKIDTPIGVAPQHFIRCLRNKNIWMQKEQLYFTQYKGECYVHRVKWDHPHSAVFKAFAKRIGI